jgi:hypothetical protein
MVRKRQDVKTSKRHDTKTAYDPPPRHGDAAGECGALDPGTSRINRIAFG